MLTMFQRSSYLSVTFTDYQPFGEFGMNADEADHLSRYNDLNKDIHLRISRQSTSRIHLMSNQHSVHGQDTLKFEQNDMNIFVYLC